MPITKSSTAPTTTLTTTESTAKTNRSKARNGRPDFPLTAHKHSNRWCKKIKGKLYYFGPWNEGEQKAAQAALEKWLEQKDDLLAGRTPRPKSDGLTIKDLVNRFLATKRHLVDTGELTARSFADYYRSCLMVADVFGKQRAVIDLAADDFERLRKHIAKGKTKANSAVSIGNEIQRVRVLFKYAYDSALIDRPIRYGQTFKRPSKATIRKARNAKGPRMFEAAELRILIAAAGVPLKAMILLGINGGMGNSDVATLPLTAVDLKRGWINYPRPKTGIGRRFPLWPETIKAIEAAIAERPAPRDDAAIDKVFVTKRRGSWAKSPRLSDGNEVVANNDNPVCKECRKLLDKLGMHRPGLGFYAIRHTFETIAGGSKDQVAVDHIMGHADPSMAGEYRERIDDERLVDVVNHVRTWLASTDRPVVELVPEGGWMIEPAPEAK
jgi:integrase